MSKIFRAMILLVLVASCGSRQYSAPRDIDNACSIVRQNPDYLRAFSATERNWGVPIPTLMAIIYQESKFIGNNRPPHQYALGVIPMGRQSSAYGYSQALDGTWEEYQRRQGGRSARRDNIRDATDFMGWYMAQTVRETGVALSDTRNQYLAYHEGRSGFKRGTYNSKAWLVRIAGEVADRAVMYDAQLRTCNRR
ncbi:lytic transglycosylase [Octadecabacter sp. SW4]|uniref:transglycosylase SLT domain-containing protein n=1 Tax=Octadecabacter sp. SW4 TaxID=2602067 RepID=UPI0011C1D363|nr:transglycosylase SLT domain-containing protein [Octadecabacter sp. SW4]QEE36929.1 lytic transglycosylase [Octadecabacter sp. SW4]